MSTVQTQPPSCPHAHSNPKPVHTNTYTHTHTHIHSHRLHKRKHIPTQIITFLFVNTSFTWEQHGVRGRKLLLHYHSSYYVNPHVRVMATHTYVMMRSRYRADSTSIGGWRRSLQQHTCIWYERKPHLLMIIGIWAIQIQTENRPCVWVCACAFLFITSLQKNLVKREHTWGRSEQAASILSKTNFSLTVTAACTTAALLLCNVLSNIL